MAIDVSLCVLGEPVVSMRLYGAGISAIVNFQIVSVRIFSRDNVAGCSMFYYSLQKKIICYLRYVPDSLIIRFAGYLLMERKRPSWRAKVSPTFSYLPAHRRSSLFKVEKYYF